MREVLAGRQGGRAAIGVDVGGTKIAAAIVGANGSLNERTVVPTEVVRGPEGVVDLIVGVVRRLLQWAKAQGVEVVGMGVATTGIVDSAAGSLTTVTEALPGFGGFGLRDRLEALVGRRVVVLNDVHAMAMAEQALGAGQGVDDVLYVAVGTGVGGAQVQDGALRLGAHGSAGDLGHIVADSSPTAAMCPCGRRGHLEALVSGPALAREYGRRTGHPSGDGGLPLVADRARAGESVAREVLLWGGEHLGRVIGGVVNFSDPALVVFGGGLLALEDELFWGRACASLQAEVRRPGPPRLKRAFFGNDAAVIGAALASSETAEERARRAPG